MGLCVSRPQKLYKSKSFPVKTIEDNSRDIFESDNEVDLDLTEGVYLSEIVNDLDSKLPKYILFKPDEVIVHQKYLNFIEHKKKISNKDFDRLQYLANTDSANPINSSNALDSNNLIYTNDKDYLLKIKKKCLNRYFKSHNVTFDKQTLNDDIHITFYNNDFKSYIIYKKLRVKFDFYYIPLSIYNAIKTQIEIMKTTQIIELLGPKNIWIEYGKRTKSARNILGDINTGFVDTSTSIKTTNDDNSYIKRGTTYPCKPGFYFCIDNLRNHINNCKHIFMSKEDYEHSFELRYLIRSRVRSFLNSYSRTLYINNLSAFETNMQLKLKSIYNKLGLNFSYNNSKFSEKSLVINVIFYDVEEICVEHEVPLSSDGFKLLYNKSLLNEQEKNKYQAHKDFFINRVMEFNELKYAHKSCLEIDEYIEILNNINTFVDINKLIDYIHRLPEYTPINDNGIKILKISENYHQDMKVFIQKIFKKVNIQNQFQTFIDEFESEDSLNNFLDNISKMKQIHQILQRFLSNIDTSSLTRNGFQILNEYNILSNNENRVKFINRYIQEYNLDTNISDLIFKLDDEKLNKFFSDYNEFIMIKDPNFSENLNDIINMQSNLELVISDNQTIDFDSNSSNNSNNNVFSEVLSDTIKNNDIENLIIDEDNNKMMEEILKLETAPTHSQSSAKISEI